MDKIYFAVLFTLWTSLFELRPNTSGTPEDFSFCVVKDSNQSSLFELRPDRVKNYDFALKCLVERSETPQPGPMKVSDSCKIQVTTRN
jgi:hypothetical protein